LEEFSSPLNRTKTSYTNGRVDQCGCFQDLTSCMNKSSTCWFLAGCWAEVVDKQATCFVFCCNQSLTGCGFLYTCGYRSRVRQTYSLPEPPYVVCCTYCWCLPRSSCQEYRELKHRGVDPAQVEDHDQD
ncbi:hypothetical protein MARPO_0175s0012, partial [Marchantia polymorpha]